MVGLVANRLRVGNRPDTRFDMMLADRLLLLLLPRLEDGDDDVVVVGKEMAWPTVCVANGFRMDDITLVRPPLGRPEVADGPMGWLGVAVG